MNIKNSRLTIKTFRRFVPDEVYDSAEEARTAIEFLLSRYDSDDGPFVYPIIINDGGKNIGYVQVYQGKEAQIVKTVWNQPS